MVLILFLRRCWNRQPWVQMSVLWGIYCDKTFPQTSMKRLFYVFWAWFLFPAVHRQDQASVKLKLTKPKTSFPWPETNLITDRILVGHNTSPWFRNLLHHENVSLDFSSPFTLFCFTKLLCFLLWGPVGQKVNNYINNSALSPCGM